MPNPLPHTRAILLSVVLLAMSSGLIDAVVYMRHGHVFAYAMTGNLVLLGIAVSTRDTYEILRHLFPLAGFAAGILAGKSILRFHRHLALHFSVLLQMTILFLAAPLAHRIPSDALVIGLAFSGAILITVIRRVGDVAFNVTFMTGNLRAVFEGAFDGLFPPPPGSHAHSLGARQFRVVGLSCLGFLTGAALGALSATRFQDRSFWIADLLLLAAGSLLRKDSTAEEA